MALTEQTILEKLHDVAAPGGRMSLVEAGAVRGIEVDGGSVKVTLAVEATQPNVAGEVRTTVETELARVEGVETVEVTVHPLLATVQTGPTHAEEPPPTWADKIPGVKHVIAVASGKIPGLLRSIRNMGPAPNLRHHRSKTPLDGSS